MVVCTPIAKHLFWHKALFNCRSFQKETGGGPSYSHIEQGVRCSTTKRNASICKLKYSDSTTLNSKLNSNFQAGILNSQNVITWRILFHFYTTWLNKEPGLPNHNHILKLHFDPARQMMGPQRGATQLQNNLKCKIRVKNVSNKMIWNPEVNLESRLIR